MLIDGSKLQRLKVKTENRKLYD